MLELVIDTREKDLIELLKGNKVEMLDIGDVLIRNGEDIIVLIERKSIIDLQASIIDGRAREQKARMMNCGLSKDRIIYLVEGDFNKPLTSKIGSTPISTLVGSMINTQLRDGIKVYKTVSLNETAMFITRLFEKVKTDLDKYFLNDDGSGITSVQYAGKLKKKKKANMTPEVWFINQLSQIPRVSETIAGEIVKIFKTSQNLIIEYEKIPEKYRILMLADIMYTSDNGISHKVGKKISERIYKYFYGISDNVEEVDNE